MRTVACLLILCLATPLLADIGPKPRKTAPGPLPQGDLEGVNVEMTAEEVKLVLSKGNDGDRLDVEATFHMTNLGEACEFEIGFPCGPYTNMKDFSATTDGAKQEFELIDRGEGDDANGGMGDHDYWYVWDASYAKGAKVTHVVKYRLEIWHFSEWRDTGYVLNTGAGWKNKIGKAVVTLGFGEGLSYQNLDELSPPNPVMSEGAGTGPTQATFTWTFENLEPTTADNIGISYNNESTFSELLAQYKEESAKFWGSKKELVYLAARAHKRFGREKMNEDELATYVAALSGLLDEMAEDGEKVTMPATGPTHIDWGGVEFPDEVKKQLEKEMGDETRDYAWKGEAHSLLNIYQRVLETARDNAGRDDVKTMLQRWNKLMGAFLAGNLYADANKMTIGGNLHDKFAAEYTKQLEEGRKLAG